MNLYTSLQTRRHSRSVLVVLLTAETLNASERNDSKELNDSCTVCPPLCYSGLNDLREKWRPRVRLVCVFERDELLSVLSKIYGF